MDKETRNYLTSVIFRIDFADPIKSLQDNIDKVKTRIEDRLSELNRGQVEMVEVAMGAEEQEPQGRKVISLSSRIKKKVSVFILSKIPFSSMSKSMRISNISKL